MSEHRTRGLQRVRILRPLAAVLVIAANLTLLPGSAGAAPGDAQPELAEVDTDDVDVDVDTLFGDEDDHDIAALDVSLILAANRAAEALERSGSTGTGADTRSEPAGSERAAPLAFTGGTFPPLLGLATVLVAAGAATALFGRRRRLTT